MTIKWTKKDAIEAITTLTSPLEKIAKNGQKPGFGTVAEKIRGLISKVREGKS